MEEIKNGIVSIREVYTLIHDMKKEVSDSINRLEIKFDALEAGRLSAVEKQIAVLTAEFDVVRRAVFAFIGVVVLAVIGIWIARIIV